MNRIGSSTDATDIVEEEQGAMKAAVDELDKSTNDEAKQARAYNALTELKKIRNKQRKF